MGCGTSSQSDQKNQNNAYEPQDNNSQQQGQQNKQAPAPQPKGGNGEKENAKSNDAKAGNNAAAKNESAPAPAASKKKNPVANVKFLPTDKFNPKAMTSCILTKTAFNEYAETKQRNGDRSFIDIKFTARPESLTKDLKLMPKAETYKWKRAKDIFDFERLRVFQKKIEPNDIRQGALGDCYFLSALSVLAERPNLIEKLFLSKLKNDEGMYAVIMCIDGEFQEIIIDDMFPVNEKNEPAFSKSNPDDVEEYGDELWVLIMEKAYAKAFGSYQNIVAGSTGNAIKDLSGAPYQKIKCKEGVEAVWEFIQSHDKKGHMMTCGSDGDNESVGKKGIVSSHAYAILDHQVVQRDGTERIIQVRNPWGNKEWNGDWSDQSSKWTEAIKEQCNWVDADDGIFWIEIHDFIKQFGDCTANLLVEDYLYTSQKVKLDRSNMALVTFHVKYDETNVHLQLTQRDDRHYAPGTYAYSLQKLMVTSKDFKTYVKDDITTLRDLNMDLTLNAGTYYAFVEVDWGSKKADVDSVVISAYSSDQVQFEVDYQQIKEDRMDDVDQMLLCKPPNPEKVKPYDSAPAVKRYVNDAAGYMYFVFDNQSQSNCLNEIVQVMNIKNLKICAPYTTSGLFTIEVNAGEKKIVKYKVTSATGGDFSYAAGYKGGIELSDPELIEEIKEKGDGDKKRREEEVWYYPFYYQKGYALLHWNKTDREYEEELELTLNNLKLLGEEDNACPEIKIRLGPGEHCLHKLVIADRSKEFSFKSALSFLLK